MNLSSGCRNGDLISLTQKGKAITSRLLLRLVEGYDAARSMRSLTSINDPVPEPCRHTGRSAD